MQRQVTFLGAFLILCACIPYDRLEKYRNEGNSLATQSAPTAKASIQEMGASSYKVPIDAVQVWDATIDVLVQSYNITLTNKETGIITTEWDSYYLGDQVFRNKVSVRLRSQSAYETMLTIHNNVESLSKNNAKDAQTLWLPANDRTNEVKRIMGNLATLLNLSKGPDEKELPQP